MNDNDWSFTSPWRAKYISVYNIYNCHLPISSPSVPINQKVRILTQWPAVCSPTWCHQIAWLYRTASAMVPAAVIDCWARRRIQDGGNAPPRESKQTFDLRGWLGRPGITLKINVWNFICIRWSAPRCNCDAAAFVMWMCCSINELESYWVCARHWESCRPAWGWRPARRSKRSPTYWARPWAWNLDRAVPCAGCRHRWRWHPPRVD